jgi:hypothetical protein
MMSDGVCMHVWMYVCMYVCTHYQIMCKDNGDITHYTHIVCLLSFFEHCSLSWTLWEKEYMCVFKVVQGIMITILPFFSLAKEEKNLIIAVR